MYLLKINFLFLIIFMTVSQIHISYGSEKYLSLKKNKVNVRYGPSFEFPIKYTYQKKNLPLKQIDQKENFRRIIDHKKNSGWIHISQLKKINSVITTKDKIMFKKSSIFSKPIAKIKKGRLLIIQKCEDKWCKVKTDHIKGWIDKNDLWGEIK
tara:strand:- start:418 stop:876 length:459 start_codon:yes stop_codon:yes gene_type:complete